MTCIVCGKNAVEGERRENAIEQSWGTLPGVSYKCNCAAIYCVRPPPPPAPELQTNGWTASVSPCSESDVDAR